MDQDKYTHLMDVVKGVPDPRKARGKRYKWSLLLGLICAGLAAGQQTAWAIGSWVKHQREDLCGLLKVSSLPSYSTIYRTLRYLPIQSLEAHIAAYGQKVAEAEAGVEVADGQVLRGQCADGKEIRGANTHGANLRLLALVRHGSATILGEQRVAEGTNELGTLPDLLADRDLTGTVTTLDAIFTQRTIAQQIIDQGGHYLMVVKKNQPTLYEDIETLFEEPPLPTAEDDRQRYTYSDHGHGRLERRTLVASEMLNEYLDWPGVGQVMRRTCERTEISKGKTSCHDTYGISSLPRDLAMAKDLEGFWRMHWTIENPLHYVRDETLGEDRGQAWKGHTAQALAALRNGLLTALRHQGWSSIADALRFYVGDLKRPLQLVGAIPS
jgi:predicted transposase YbfD/YdcC